MRLCMETTAMFQTQLGDKWYESHKAQQGIPDPDSLLFITIPWSGNAHAAGNAETTKADM